MVGHHPLRLLRLAESLLHRFRRNIQELGGGGNQLFFRQEAVPGREVIAQLKEDTGLHPAGVVPCHPQLNGEAIHRPEGGIQAVIHQKVGIII